MNFINAKKIFHWTTHSRGKMRFYGLSEGRVRRVIHSPKRVEEGIAPNTVAMMQPVSIKGSGAKETWNQEIWVMLKKTLINADVKPIHADKKSALISQNRHTSAAITIISAWRYPGKTRPGQPIPSEILREIKSFL